MDINKVSSIIKAQTDNIVGASNRVDFNDPNFTIGMKEWMRNNISIYVINYTQNPYNNGPNISIAKSINFQVELRASTGDLITTSNCIINISQ